MADKAEWPPCHQRFSREDDDSRRPARPQSSQHPETADLEQQEEADQGPDSGAAGRQPPQRREPERMGNDEERIMVGTHILGPPRAQNPDFAPGEPGSTPPTPPPPPA